MYDLDYKKEIEFKAPRESEEILWRMYGVQCIRIDANETVDSF